MSLPAVYRILVIRSRQIIPADSTASFRRNPILLGFWQRAVAKLIWALIVILILPKVAGIRRIVYQWAFLTGTRHGELKALRCADMDFLSTRCVPPGQKPGNGGHYRIRTCVKPRFCWQIQWVTHKETHKTGSAWGAICPR